MTPDWPIETERLVLRPHEEGDFEAFHELYGDEEVVRWLYEGRDTAERSRERLAKKLTYADLVDGSGLNAAVLLRDGAYVGDLGLWYDSFEHRTVELGYAFVPRQQGNGYATESCRALLDWAFAAAGVHRVIARLEARNFASARVAEKLGMRREAHFVENEWVKGEWQSELVYAILEREWQR